MPIIINITVPCKDTISPHITKRLFERKLNSAKMPNNKALIENNTGAIA
jgi:hypothetical protein